MTLLPTQYDDHGSQNSAMRSFNFHTILTAFCAMNGGI